jgi:hypothetical protein
MRGALGFICFALVTAACSDDGSDPATGGNAPAGGSASDDGGSPPAGGAGDGGAPVGGSAPEGGAGEGGSPTALPTSIPDYFRLTGIAEGTDGEVNASCSLDFIFELQAATEETAELIAYPGTHGGEAFRMLVDDQGAGFSFHADVFGEVIATLHLEDGRLDLAIPINETAKNAFFLQMALFQGVLNADGTGGGDWRCAPLETTQDGYEDTVVWIDGKWEIEPIVD